jgi:Glycosyl hydrolase family 12
MVQMAARRARGRGATRIVMGVFLVAGAAAGCSAIPKAGSLPPIAVTTAAVPVTATPASSGASKTASKTKPRAKATRSPATRSPSPTVSPSHSGAAPTHGAAPSPTVSATAPDPTTPAPRQSHAPTGGAAFTASCQAHASSSAPGCGSWDAGASSGQAPGFASGQQSSPNLFDVNQDPWSGGQGQQTITASSFQDWSVTATDTDPSNAPGEVLTYPDASVNYYQVDSPSQYDLNKITSLTSDFTESMPDISDLNAEAAYDIWLNNWQTEVMVWVATSPGKDRNLADSGDTKVATYTFDGQKFSLWRNGSGITGFYIFLLDHSESSGMVDLKPMLETLVSLGEIPAASPLTEIPFGWEVSDTGGKPVTFSMSRFDVDLQN